MTTWPDWREMVYDQDAERIATDLVNEHTPLLYLDPEDGSLVMEYVADDTPDKGFCPACGAPVTLRLGTTWRHDAPAHGCDWRLDWPPPWPDSIPDKGDSE